MFAYKEYARKALEAGITNIIFSIHGHNEKLHDSLTQVEGSFSQMVRGVKNVVSLGFRHVGSNTVIVKQNYKFLPRIGKFVYEQGIRSSEFTFIDPTHGGAYNYFKELVPKISEAAPYVRKCLDIGRSKMADWRIRYIPICHFIGYEYQISELYEPRRFQTEHLGIDVKNFYVEGGRRGVDREKTGRCKDCVYFYDCEGIWKVYVKYYGDYELTPVISKGDDFLRGMRGPFKVSIKRIKIGQINYFTRDHHLFSHDETVDEYMKKIRKKERIFPIRVGKDKNGQYHIQDGHSRYLAFKKLGYKAINCEVITG